MSIQPLGDPIPQRGPAPDGTGASSAPVSLARILVCLDASPQADRALAESVRLAASARGTVTGIHAYAAKLHDRRFRQMEGGLPERYRKEDEMERQREVHDTLITRGLGIISDSYHEQAETVCQASDVPFRRLSPEGKNYRRIVEAASSGAYDVIALGAVGLGAIPGALVGTVCERVVRRSPIDTLVIRDAGRAIADGPVVVGIDGSTRAFGALLTALDIAERTGAEVRAVAAYDPFFHYVAFDKIAATLSDEAAQTFKFKDQEKLHEEIIDSGIARIYQSHLDVARGIAKEHGRPLATELLEGKPWRAIADYLAREDASLLVIGKTGVHADPDLDIGGNAENLLRIAPCHVWLGCTHHTPPLEAIARETISWTEEAEAMLGAVPERARPMVRMAILRLAQESGHTVVTRALVEEASRRFCPESGGRMTPERTPAWSPEARALIDKIADPGEGAAVRLRAEKKARRAGAREVLPEHVRPFLDEFGAPAPQWTAAALATLARAPELDRPRLRRAVEAAAKCAGAREIDHALVQAAMGDTPKPSDAPRERPPGAARCPFAHGGGEGGDGDPPA